MGIDCFVVHTFPCFLDALLLFLGVSFSGIMTQILEVCNLPLSSFCLFLWRGWEKARNSHPWHSWWTPCEQLFSINCWNTVATVWQGSHQHSGTFCPLPTQHIINSMEGSVKYLRLKSHLRCVGSCKGPIVRTNEQNPVMQIWGIL